MRKPTQILPAHYISKGTLDLSTNRKAAVALSLLGIALFFVFGGLFIYAIGQMRPQDTGEMTSVVIHGLGSLLLAILIAVAINIVVVVLHEAVHGVFIWLFTRSRPGFAFKIWYAYASAPTWYLPRNQYLIVALAPLVVLTVLGFALAPFIPAGLLVPLLLFMTLNASGAVGDIGVAIWLLFQPPDCLANDRGDAVTLYVPGA